MLQRLLNAKPTEDLTMIMEFLREQSVPQERFSFSPTLARGLDYYTGLIFEIEIEGYEAGSVCGGGRYDNLIGMFNSKPVPAVGCAFGFDRILEAMEQFSLFPSSLETTKFLVAIFSKELAQKSIEVCSRLRSNNINTELWLDAQSKMEKQLKYADQKQIPYTIIIGPDEVANDTVTLKDMRTREQQQISIEKLIENLK